MISSFRNFAKTKIAGVFVFIIIIPFVFWGMGSMFNSGNTNNIAKINNTNISTKDFMDYLNSSGIPQQTIKDNLSKNIIEELLSGLISENILNLEIEEFDLTITEKTLSNKIKTNKNFLDDNNLFQRKKYEKFLLTNNTSAPLFEMRLKNREIQKQLFDYIGAGTTSPRFLTKRLFEKENEKLKIEFINLNNFYKKKEKIDDSEIQEFLDKNNEQLKVEYIDFDYTIITPKNLIGSEEFNQTFFNKIDEIEIDISNNVDYKTLTTKFNIKSINVSNFKYSSEKKEVEKKIFEARNIKYDIIENNNEYILYNINKSEENIPDIKDNEVKKEILELIYQKNKFDYNNDLLKKINEKKFNDEDFVKMGQNNIETLTLNSIKDNKKFEINAVELIYSLPIDSFTLINDEKKNIYLVKVRDSQKQTIDVSDNDFKTYSIKQNSNNKNSILKSYDLFLNKKYNVVLNQKTIERVKNFFQ